MPTNHLVWIRNDIRWLDNPALYFAASQANQTGAKVTVLITATTEQWQAHNESDAKTGLRAELIKTLEKHLATLGIPLYVIDAALFTELPNAINAFCLEHSIGHVWFNAELPLDEQHRDHQVTNKLKQHSIEVHQQEADLIVSQHVYNQQGLPFKVFTPFFKRWLSLLETQDLRPYPAPMSQGRPISFKDDTLTWAKNFRRDLWPPDQETARERLWLFCHHKEANYDIDRDYPSKPATSTLSPYLALGALGPRQCLEAILYTSQQTGKKWQDSIWLKELAWRDFYRQLMLHFPKLSKGLPFKAETRHLTWQKNSVEQQAWREGKTGFPIVDAAMRQLNQTGWMHNRLRMITASFFCKLLFADWRQGEDYFMNKLIDGEFAANNGGWQWSASTGCDAAPYFRVFNPTRQSESYDKEGDFIRRFVPELQSLDKKAIHNPTTEQRQICQYPEPIIDYKLARASAIQAFSNLKHL